jgi:hypothetical protein
VKPVTVSAVVPGSPQDVQEFLEVLANHEPFLDHLFTEWSFSGPRRGVGAKGRARANVVASQDWTEFEIVEVAPGRIVESGVGAGGKRRTRGTYRFEPAEGGTGAAPAAEGGTRLSFELEWLEAPRAERLVTPLTRAFARRANARAMRRLAKQLSDG